MKYGSGPGPAAGGQFPDLARGWAGPFGGLRFAAQRDVREVPGEARRRRHAEPAEVLVGVFASERDPQWAVAAGLV